MISVSLCMIVKNEEDVIGRCLDSVSDLVDEIIIVDTGSTDRTKDIAKNYTSKVFDFEWINDFSAARNFAFSKATMDYILWLDADDIILEKDRKLFKKLKDVLSPDADVVMMKYNVGFDSDGNVILSYFRERLLKRSKNFKWIEPIHEYIAMDGNIVNTDICVTHKKIHPPEPGRNLKIFEKILSRNEALSPRSLFYYSRELYFNGRYDEAIVHFEKFLESGEGWVEDNITACFDVANCYKLKNNEEKYFGYLLKSLEYDTPRAHICCHIGQFFMDKGDYTKAVFWYDIATRLQKPEYNWGFTLHDYYGYIPYLQLCVCYHKLGDIEKAIECNNKAADFKPEDWSVEYNRKYFEGLKENS